MKLLINCLFGLCFWLLSASLFAQPATENFRPLESQGEMPADFQNILNHQKEMSDYNVLLKNLVMDGQILLGTPLNDYVDEIVNNLTQNDLQLRKQLHIYILKSPVVNACITSNGILLVNVGLLAQVTNESELAFVLAHEISHFTEKHVDRINDYRGTLSNRDAFSSFLKYHNRSRAHELAADRIALERFFKDSPYSYQAMMGVFDVLQYAGLPFDEVPFQKSWVETNFYQFPDKYYLPNIEPIRDRSGIVDTLFTHPNVDKRRTAARTLINGLSDAGRGAFAQPEERFLEMREIARFECVSIFLLNHQFDDAYYNACVLQQKHPDNAFLNEAVVAALYGLAKHKGTSTASDVLHPYKEVEGEMQQTSYFMSKLSHNEAALLALRTAWQMKLKYPDNQYFDDVSRDLMTVIFVQNKLKLTDFSDYPMGANLGAIELEPQEAQPSEGDKYSHIKNRSLAKVVPTDKFKTHNYMLVDIHRDEAFLNAVYSVMDDAENEDIMSVVSRHQPTTARSIVIMQPMCAVWNRNMDMDYQKSVRCEQRLTKVLSQSARRLKITPLSYSVKDVCHFTIEEYNGYVQLRQWACEYAQANAADMVFYTARDMSAAYNLTGTKTLCISMVSRKPARFFNTDKFLELTASVICPFTLPFTLIPVALPQYSTTMYLSFADFDSGRTLCAHRDNQISAMSAAYVNSFMYDTFYGFVKGK